MNVLRLANRVIGPAIRQAVLKNNSHLNIKSNRYGNRSIIARLSFGFSSNDKQPKKDNEDKPKGGNNNEDPNKKKKSDNWKDIFQEKVRQYNEKFDKIYQIKFPVRSLVIAALIGVFATFAALTNQPQQMSIQQFANLIETGSFKEITFVSEQFFFAKNIKCKKVEGKINNQIFYVQVSSFDLFYEIVMRNPEVKFKNENRLGFQFLMQKSYILIDTVVLMLILGVIISSNRAGAKGGMGQMGMEQSKKFQVTKNVTVKFNDVAGLHEVKRQVQEIVDFLKHPDKYTNLGASLPKGVLLTGPPGTGKTLLAKACAGEAGVPFYSVSGSDFVQKFVGVGAARVRQLFKEAKSSQNPAIIFIDELDAIGKKRMNKLGGNDERESTLNQLLVQMDGFGTSSKVIVMGATNRKEILDNALVRPGRFDREVQVGLPDLKGRFEIFLVHLKPLKLSSKYTMQDYARRLASLTPGFSGAEIANLCNEAAILSARHGKQVVQMIDFQLSSERVIGGVERKGFVSMQERKTVAYHECGHAVVSWFLQGADPLLKVTIIPRSKGALGFAQYFINQNQLQTREELLDRVCFILGGRCTEQHFFNEITTGAYDDLSKAYELVYGVIARYGMDEQIGYLSYPDVQYVKPYGEKVQSKIDEQIKKIIRQCTQKTKKIIAERESDIKRLAEQLLIKQTLDVRAIQKILGKRPFPPNKTFQEYLETSESA